MQWKTHRGSVPLLGLWSLARTLPKKLGSQVTPGEGRRVGLYWTLTWIVSSLVRKLGCVKSQATERRVGLNKILLKKGSQLLFKELLSNWLVKSKDEAHHMDHLEEGSRAQGLSSPHGDLSQWESRTSLKGL